MKDSVLTGSCYCGDIRYRIESRVLRAVSCHCETCSRTIADHVDWLTVPSNAVVLVSGEPVRRTNGPVTRTFCGRCGTRLTYRDDDRGETDVTASSLDEASNRMTDVPQRAPEYSAGMAASNLHT